MKKKSLFSLAAFVVGTGATAFALISSGLVMADIPPAPEIGTKVANFTMKDYEGKEHSLEAHKGQIVVLSFTSHKCPVSKGCEKAFAETAAKYKEKGVVFLSIDSHNSTPPAEIKEYATASNDTGKTLPYPILKDEGNVYADTLGAKVTPEIYIVDKEGKLAYHGALDNSNDYKPGTAEYKNYVAQALDELLADKPVSLPKQSAYGCTIKRVAGKKTAS
ncbi:MAG: thioredoxin family protein [Candidatus Hydrogenedentota bacterium]